MADTKQRITLPFDVAIHTTYGQPGQEIPSHQELHSAGDLVAIVAGMVFEETRLREALDEFLARMAADWSVGHDDRHPVHQTDHVLRAAFSEVLGEGARIGVALYATLQDSAVGWQAWADAARAQLQRSGCDVDVHTARLVEEIRDLGNRLRDGQRKGPRD